MTLFDEITIQVDNDCESFRAFEFLKYFSLGTCREERTVVCGRKSSSAIGNRNGPGHSGGNVGSLSAVIEA